MLKALLVPVLATGLALGGASKPANALSAEEAAALIGGLALIGILASQGNNRAEASTPSTPVYSPTPQRPWNVLPAQCLRRVETDRGVRSLAGERCLERNGARISRLPERCEVRVRTNRGLRDAYRQRCLEKAGFRFRDTDTRHHGGRLGGDRTHDGRVILDARR